MADDTLSGSLQDILEQQSKKVTKRASTVLFRRGDSAAGMFLVLSGKVNLDAGADSVPTRSYGPGEVVGMYSTLTGHKYSITATVTEDAELGFWSPEALESLWREHPDLCRPLLAILGVRIAAEDDDDIESPWLKRNQLLARISESRIND
jgi:CRP-like cAMP-binding protein